jgi:hypothetical protein
VQSLLSTRPWALLTINHCIEENRYSRLKEQRER